jgi:Polyphosphate kinase 2 (PPK2)
VGFKKPTPDELTHDFLWRVHTHVPGKGEITVFNRSHYEDGWSPALKPRAPCGYRQSWIGQPNTITGRMPGCPSHNDDQNRRSIQAVRPIIQKRRKRLEGE